MDPTVTVALVGGASTFASTAIGVLATRRLRASEEKRAKAEREKAHAEEVRLHAEAKRAEAERSAERLAREQERIDARHERLLDNLQEENDRLRRILAARENP